VLWQFYFYKLLIKGGPSKFVVEKKTSTPIVCQKFYLAKFLEKEAPTITEPSLSPGDLAEEEMDIMRDEITPPSSLQDMMSR
jgi:hypothetical protein